MPLALEARSAGGAVRHITLTSGSTRVEAVPGTAYRFVNEPALAKPAELDATVKRVDNNLLIEGLSKDQSVELDGFFSRCSPQQPCTLSLDGLGGRAGAQILPTSEPLAALPDGAFLLHAAAAVAPDLPAAADAEFGFKPYALGLGSLAIAGAGGGGGGGGASTVATSGASAPTFTGPLATNHPNPVFSGSADPGARVTLSLGINHPASVDATFNTVAGADGTWSVDTASLMPTAGTLPAGGLPNGAIVTLTARAVATSGAISAASSESITVDTVPPGQSVTIVSILDQVAPLVGTVANGASTNDSKPIINGTLSDLLTGGDFVRVYRNGVAVGIATVNATSWSLAEPTALADGSYSYTVRAEDVAGNQAALSSAYAVTIDTVAPVRPQINTVAGDNIVNAAESALGVTVTGSAEAHSAVSVLWLGFTQVLTADATGHWSASFAPNQIQGTGQVQPLVVTATDAAGNVSAPATLDVTVATGKPATPVVSPVTGDDIVNAAEASAPSGVVVSGTATAGETVTITWAGAPPKTALSDATGHWSVTFASTQLPADGTSTITVVGTDAAGNVSQTGTHTVLLDRIAPGQPVIAPIDGNDQVNLAQANAGVIVAGTAEANSQVRVSVGNAVHMVTAGGNGAISALFSSAELPTDGTISVSALATDAAGNAGPPATRSIQLDRVPPATPTIAAIDGNDVVNLAQAAAGVIVSGNAEAASLVQVSFEGAVHFVSANSAGSYATVFGSSELSADGTGAVTAVATDAVGNASSAASRNVVIDRVPPPPPALAPVDGSSSVNKLQAAAGVVVNGTAEANSSVTLTWSGVTHQVLANGNGTFSVLFASAEIGANGNTTLSATATDGAGNVSAAATQTVQIDRVAPGPPSIAAVDGNDIVNMAQANLGVMVSGTAEANSHVTVTWGASTHAVTAAANGAYSTVFGSAELPADGTTTVSALATDAAGNVGATTFRPVLIDRVVPAAPVLAAVDGNDVVNLAQASAGVTIAGTATAGGQVRISFDGATHTVTANASGAFSTVFASSELAADGIIAVSAVALDAAGNASNAASRTVLVDRVPPAPPGIGIVAGDDVVSYPEKAAAIAVSGTAEAGATVRVTWGGISHSVTALAGAFTTTFTAAEVPADGAHPITAIATDAAGNASSIASHSVTIDTAATTFTGTFGPDSFTLTALKVQNLSAPGATIDGAAGLNTLLWGGSGIALDLTNLPLAAVNNFQQFNLTGTGNNTVKLNLADVLHVGGANLFDSANGWTGLAATVPQKQVVIDGNASDSVTASGGFTDTGTTATHGGHTYEIYLSGTTAADAMLLIDTTIVRHVA